MEVLANGRKRVLKSINQVILAAADVDSAIMPNLAKHAVKNCKRTISYVSDKDKALKISGWLHNFPRVGITPPKFVFNGMDTVIVNKLGLGNFSHGYPASSRIIMSDIFNLLKANKPPSERYAIESVSLDGVQYWRMKD
ncbi:MAG: alpha/beta hydrolase [Rhizobiaceae bacterium]|nr:MAG: alpha/beta hydrolase [Rhizobiaceae bacterium]